MNENILISIIVPIYNVEKYLDRCVQSILKQTYKNIEIILVDDGSLDNCGTICDEYEKKDKRVRAIHKENGGLSSARNTGIKMAKGEYVCFVDSDDWIEKNMIEHISELIIKNRAEIVSVSYALAKNENIKVKKRTSIKVMSRNEALEYFFEIGMHKRISDYPIWIKGIKKELFNDVEFPEGTLYEDYVTNIELISKVNTYVKSSKVCYFYFQGDKSIVRSEFKLQDMQLISQCEKAIAIVANKGSKIQNLAKLKLFRSSLSLLTKIALYGFAEEINEDEQRKIIAQLTQNLRNNFLKLLFSSLPFTRKILLCVLCIDYRILRIFKKTKEI